jgi:hypothetical protein
MIAGSRLLLRFSTSDFLEFQLAVHHFELLGRRAVFFGEIPVF